MSAGHASGAPPRADAQRQAELLDALAGSIPKVGVPLSYRLGLVLVAVAMVMLPMAYLAIVGAIVAGMYFYALGAVSILEGGGVASTFIFGAPLFVGGLLVLFMLKPFFARRPQSAPARALDPAEEPLLFAFVERLCGVVGSPVPREIRVDVDINASASFRRGVLSVFGRDVVLTIGLPLVAGLSIRQLTGVLAHEFGHFAQATGMRLSFFVRSVNGWLYRVSTQEDSWDRWLSRTSERGHVGVRVVLYVARFFVWLTRKLLFGLMLLGHALSSYLLRQMEFDADRYEVYLAGSEAFGQTARRCIELHVSMEGVYEDLAAARRDGRLPDDVCISLLGQRGQVREENYRRAEEARLTEHTSWDDSHPCDRERVAAAERVGGEGIFRVERPASELFADFGSLSQKVTRDYYVDVLGEEELAKVRFVSAEVELARAEREVMAGKSLARFAQGPLMMRPLPLGADIETMAMDALSEELETLRRDVLDWRKDYDERLAKFDQADDAIIESHQAGALLSAGYALEVGQFGLTEASMDGASQLQHASMAAQRQLEPKMQRFEQQLGRRLSLARVAVESGLLDDVLVDCAALKEQLVMAWPLMEMLCAHVPAHVELRNHAFAADTLLQQEELTEAASAALVQLVSSLTERLTCLVVAFEQTPYPFVFADDRRVSIAKFLALDGIPPSEDVCGVLSTCSIVGSQMHELYFRVFTRLAEVCEAVERALGLPDLPEASQAVSLAPPGSSD